MSTRGGSPIRGLLLACHPLPCLAVTAFAAAWALANDLRVDRVALVGAAVLLGQLSIGWSNDAIDARRDVDAGRTDKPVPRGLVPARLVAISAGAAAIACVPASLALGVRPGVVHLIAVASAWAYNLGAKSTLGSPLPYALSFGLLPSVVVGWPPAGVSGAAALLGVAAHFANTVGDSEADAATGVRGLPQRIGPVASLRVCALAVTGAAGCLLVVGGVGFPTVAMVAGALLAGAVAVVGPRLGRWAFRVVLVAVGLVVAAFLLVR